MTPHLLPDRRADRNHAEIGYIGDPIPHVEGCLHVDGPVVGIHWEPHLRAIEQGKSRAKGATPKRT